MANYDSSKRIDQLDVITAINNADIVPIFDTSDADFKTKQITWADTLLSIASATKTLTNTTIDADGTGNAITNIDDGNIKASAGIDATKIANGGVSNTEFQYLDGVTSAIQTQLTTALTQTITHERGGLEADVSAFSGLVKISAGATSQAVANTDYAGATHASRHATGQADEVNGDELDIDFTPSNYTSTTGTPGASTASLASHLRGIDNTLGAGNLSRAINTTLNSTFWTQQYSWFVDGWTKASSGITLTQDAGIVILESTTTGSDRYYAKLMGTSTTNDYATAGNKDLVVRFMAKGLNPSSSGADVFAIGVGEEGDLDNDISANGQRIAFAYSLATDKVYAVSGNSSGVTATDIDASVTSNAWNEFTFVYTVGTDIKFYVNQVLVATHTTNMPSMSTTVIGVGVDTNGSTTQIVRCTPLIVSIEL